MQTGSDPKNLSLLPTTYGAASAARQLPSHLVHQQSCCQLVPRRTASPGFNWDPSRSTTARSICVEHFHGNGTSIGEVCVLSTNSASFTPPAFNSNQKSILLWSKFHLKWCSSSKLPLLSLKTTWSLSWSKLRVTDSLVLASSVKTLPAHPTPPCLAKGGQASFYMMLISQNSSEGSLLTLHTGLSNVQKLTNVKKDSF